MSAAPDTGIFFDIRQRLAPLQGDLQQMQQMVAAATGSLSANTVEIPINFRVDDNAIARAQQQVQQSAEASTRVEQATSTGIEDIENRVNDFLDARFKDAEAKIDELLGKEPELDKLSRQVDGVGKATEKAQQPVKGLDDLISRIGQNLGFGRAADGAMAMAGKLAAAFAIVKAAQATLQIGSGLIDMGGAMLSGDLERQETAKTDLRETVTRAPIIGNISQLGDAAGEFADRIPGSPLGMLRQGVRNLFGTMSAEEVEAFEKEQAKVEEKIKKELDRAGKIRQYTESIREQAKATNRAEARRDVTGEQAAVLDAADSLADFDEDLRKQQQATGIDPSQNADVQKRRKSLQRQLNAAVEEEQKAHGQRMAGIQAEAEALVARRAHDSRAAERALLVNSLDQEVDAIKDAEAKKAQIRLGTDTLAAFDAETDRLRNQAIADLNFQADQANLRMQGRDAEARQAAIRKGFDDRIALEPDQNVRTALAEARDAELAEAAANEKRRLTLSLAEYQASVREDELRAAGSDYQADVVAYEAAWRQKIEAITNAAEKQAAIRAKVAEDDRREAERVREIANLRFSTGQIRLELEGNDFEARRRAIEEEFEREFKAAEGDPQKQDELRERRNAQLDQVERDRDLMLDDLNFQQSQLDLRSRGQNRTAELEAIERETERMLAESGGDPEVAREIRELEASKLQALRRDIELDAARQQFTVTDSLRTDFSGRLDRTPLEDTNKILERIDNKLGNIQGKEPSPALTS
jgi:hypothetical protein